MKSQSPFACQLKMLIVLSIGWMTGCGGIGPQPNYSDLGLVEISGTIRLDGIPLANAFIQFEDEDGTYCYSDVDSQGRYRLRFDSNTYGTIPGKKIVRIRMGQANSENFTADAEDPDSNAASAPASSIQLPACYNRQSVLIKQVTGSESNVDFDLRSEGIAVSAQ